MHLWNRARAAFGCVASVCRAIKLGSEGRGAKHKNLKVFFTRSLGAVSNKNVERWNVCREKCSQGMWNSSELADYYLFVWR